MSRSPTAGGNADDASTRLIRTLSAVAFLLGPAIYLAAEAISAAAWRSPTYSYADNWVSDLGSATSGVFQGRELGSPLHVVMNLGFITQGLLFGIGAVLLSRTITGHLRSFTAVMGVVVAIGNVLVGTFHVSLQAGQNDTQTLHVVGAFLAIVGANLLALVLGIHWRNASGTRTIGIVSIIVGALGLGAAIVLVLTSNADVPSGLIERICVYSIFVWQVSVAVALLRARPAAAPLPLP